MGRTVESFNDGRVRGPWSNELTGLIAGSAVQARNIEGGIHISAPDRGLPPAPAQLPPPGLFADRRAELEELRRLSHRAGGAGDGGLVVIAGPGGVGKTTLALHWLHQVKAGYEGQLFVDMRGFSGGEPLPPTEPLERFLRALGASADGIPPEIDEQAALFRSVTTGRRLIIMLDNVVSAAQVRPLLPGAGPALVVVTTRRQLSGLLVDGARFLDLHPLGVPGALELLGHIIGPERIGAEREQARSLVRLCGLLPLAVCASGARLAARRRWPIARVVDELGDEARRLDQLRTGEGDTEEGDMSVMAVFNASYRALNEAHARAYRLLGTHPGPHFDIEAAAALLGGEHDRTVELLDGLVDVSLLAEESTDRYRFHDLVRLHARAKAEELDSDGERNAAFARLADWYLRTAVAADLLLLPGRWRLGVHYQAEHRAGSEDQGRFTERSQALAWLEREQPNLVAVAQQAHALEAHTLAWEICEAMWSLLLHRRYYQVWIQVHQLGLAAAEACADLPARARMLEGLGMAHHNLRDYSAAREHFQAALDLERRAGHRIGEASALEGLGLAEQAAGADARALELFTLARDLHAELGRPRGVALMRRHIGQTLSVLGRHAEAIDSLDHALRYFTGTDELYHQARTLGCLGRARLRADEPADAATTLREALVAARRAGARQEEANVLHALADVAVRHSDRETERLLLQKALDIYTALDAPQSREVEARLAELPAIPPGHERPDDPPHPSRG
ncbi:ATP-binding protein [Actinomadura rugatobispora]|uniref:ATP-binding protein n=1 Tax=Actinomadura rugatobispora TaxID=1994 RepID=A0ABW1A719_9ACTN|nr:tetratricopeptide repeat protein [Actinomadura rugatobispora]